MLLRSTFNNHQLYILSFYRNTTITKSLNLNTYRTSPMSNSNKPVINEKIRRGLSTKATAVGPAAGGGGGGGEKVVNKDAIKEGDPITIPSLSASLVLLAPLEQRTPDGYDYRVLLLKRNAKSGNLDPIDKDVQAWSQFFPPSSSSSSSSSGSEGEEEVAQLRAVKLCAVRETFEECGILLIEGQGNGKGRERWSALGEGEKKEWRDRVYKDGKTFVDLFKLLSGDDEKKTLPGISALQYRANWITPATMKRRFDTHFFFSILPPSSTPSSSATRVHSEYSATSDGGETVSADWMTPQEAINRTLLHTKLQQSTDASDSDTLNSVEKEKEIDPSQTPVILFPPQFYLISELARTKSWKDLLPSTSSSYSSSPSKGGIPLVPARKIVPFEPEIKGVEDSYGQFRAATVLIGDPEHSKTDLKSMKPSDRHRTYVLLPAKKKDPKWKAKAPLGLTVMGVHREGMGRLFGEGWDVTMKEGDIGEGGATSGLPVMERPKEKL